MAGYPDFSTWQPFLDDIVTHPAPDAFREAHNFRRTIDIPGFHATTWYDIFLTSVLTAYSEIQARVGNQRLWIGPNDHYFIYEKQFWPRDPYFEWFDYWLKDADTQIMREQSIHYSPLAWTDNPAEYVAKDWQMAERWPVPEALSIRLFLGVDGVMSANAGSSGTREFIYNPRYPVPTYGGRNMAIDAGPLDQRPAEVHSNYGLTYLGGSLETSMTLAGPVSVLLHVSSDCPDTDFVAKLVEVFPDNLKPNRKFTICESARNGQGRKPRKVSGNCINIR